MHKSLKLSILISSFLVLMAFQQEKPVKDSWDTLVDIEFDEKYVEDIKGYMLFPKFPADIKKLDGRIIQVEGYVIPVDKEGAYIALSANPYASCFFCGKAGPASVMTVKLKKKGKFRTDDYTTFSGKLRLNSKDINEFYYILEGSEIVH